MQVTWAHPVFGRLLAVADSSGAISIWEEALAEGQPPAFYAKPALLDSQQAVTAMDFAPPQQGLQLAAASADRHVRHALHGPASPDAALLTTSLQPAGCMKASPALLPRPLSWQPSFWPAQRGPAPAWPGGLSAARARHPCWL